MNSSLRKTIRREVEIAFSRKVQKPVFRIIKYLVIGLLVYFFRDTKTFWWIFGIALFLALALHLFTRYKTRGWTQSWGAWKYEKSKYDEEEEESK